MAYKPKKTWIIQILSQCPECKAVEFIKNKKDEIGWQNTFVDFETKPKKLCPSCQYKKNHV